MNAPQADRAPKLVPVLARTFAGPFVWLVHLLGVYAATSVACARGAGDLTVLGIGLLPLIVAIATLAALSATAVVLALAWRDEHAPESDPPVSDAQRFAGRVTIALCSLSLVGIVWTVLPVVWLPICDDAGDAAAGLLVAVRAARRRPRRALLSRRALRIFAASAAAVACAACRAESTDPVVTVAGGDPARGRAIVAAVHCGVCHVIPGVRGARGVVGPPLEGFALRTFIGGQLANTPENLVRWVRDPPAVDPRTAMPALGLDERQARDVAAFLYELR